MRIGKEESKKIQELKVVLSEFISAIIIQKALEYRLEQANKKVEKIKERRRYLEQELDV